MTPDRRTFLAQAGLATLALGTGALAAGCSSSSSTPTPAGPVTLPADSVPVGGGTILATAPYVVTQPEAGVFKAFNKACTHQGCPVSGIENAEITCRCHGARFSIADGAVTNGPATRPLREVTASVEGDQVVISPA